MVECVLPASTQKDHVIRKLFLGVWLCGPLQHVVWDNVSMSVVRSVSPDAGGLLDSIPRTWDAAEASRWFFDRADRAPFLSMWGCLFREVDRMCENHLSPTAGDYVFSQLRSGEFLSVASGSSDSLAETPAEVTKQLLLRHEMSRRKKRRR